MKDEAPVVQLVPYATRAYDAVWQLREAVLRQPLGLSLRDEELRGEAAEIILALFDGDAAIGCILLKPVDAHTGKLRQMAVAPGRQRQGLGQHLLRAAEEAARQRGITHLTLHARETAVPFYERLGYAVTGAPFIEVGIPHRVMEKRLPA